MAKKKYPEGGPVKPVSDNTRTVTPAGVPMNIQSLSRARGEYALPVSNGMPTINLPLVEVTAPINMTRYGMKRDNPKYKKVKEIEDWYGVDAARDYLYGTQLSDLSDKMGEVFSDALITAGTADIPIGKLFKGKVPVTEVAESKAMLGKFKGMDLNPWPYADDVISDANHPTLIQQARMSTPEMRAKYFKQIKGTKPGFYNEKPYGELIDDVYGQTNLHNSKESSALGFSTGYGDPGSIQSNMKSQDFLGMLGKRASNINRAVTEAHEKTHGVVSRFSDEMMKDLENSVTSKKIAGYKKDELADELTARMAMFKNTLGMSGNEEFTKAQMDYLRSNYKSLPAGFDYKKVFDIVPKNSKQETQFINNMNKYALGTAGTIGTAATIQNNSSTDNMKKNNGGLIQKYADGGIPGDPVPASTTPAKKLTAAEIKKKYNNPYTNNGREQWGEYLETKKLPFSHSTVKKAIYNAAQSSGLDPALLYSSAMEEGLREGIDKPDNVSEAYSMATSKKKFDENEYPIDGFRTYGLDTFGDQYAALKKKGYLPEGFEKQFTQFEALNEQNGKVHSAAFKTEDAALQAKAAMLRSTRDNLGAYAKKNNIKLSDKQQDFFNLVGYNAGEGNMQKMIQSYKQKGYLKDDNFLTDTNFKPASYGQPYTYAQRRLVNDDILKKEGYFQDYQPAQQATQQTTTQVQPVKPQAQVGTMPDGGMMSGSSQQQYASLVAQYGKTKADSIVNQQGLKAMSATSGTPYGHKGYEPNQAIKSTKASLAAISLGTGVGSNPISYLANVAGAVYDAGTATKYLLDGQTDNALADYTQAGLGLLPGMGVLGAKGEKVVSQGQKIFNAFTQAASTGTNVETLREGFNNGGKMRKAADGIGLPYRPSSVSTEQDPLEYDPMKQAQDQIAYQFSQPQGVSNDASMDYNPNLQQQVDPTVYPDTNPGGSNAVDPGGDDEKGPSKGLKIAQKIAGAIPTINTSIAIQGTAAIANLATQGKQQTEEYARRVKRYNQQQVYNPNAYGTGSQALMNDGGSVKGLSDNQFGSEIIQFNGPSHENGGIPINYNGQNVEVEGGETGFIDPRGDMNIFGNMIVPGTNKKFKDVSKKLAKQENKTQSDLDKSVDLVNNNEQTSRYQKYNFNAGAVMMESNTVQLQDLDQIKNELAGMQNVMLNMGHDEKSSMKGKLKNGGKVGYANSGLDIFGGPGRGAKTVKRTPKDEVIPLLNLKVPDLEDPNTVEGPQLPVTPLIQPTIPQTNQPAVPVDQQGNPAPGPTPTISRAKNSFPLSQVLPEIFTLATERPEFVPGQTYEPNLYNPYQVTFQDKLNENNASFRASQIAAGNNPAALAQLNAQKYQADSQVLGEEFRTNQAIENQITNQNVSLLNDAQLRNIGYADQQMVRQSQARSNTRENQRNAMNSISAKAAQARLEQQTLGIYENMFPHFTFADDGKLAFQDTKRPVFQGVTSGVGVGSTSDFQRSRVQYDKNGKVEKTVINTPSRADMSKQMIKQDNLEKQRLGLFKKIFK